MLTIKSNIEKKLLIYYFANTQTEHHLSELARILTVDPANLDKKIKQLEHDGLFKVHARGNQKIYSLNHHFPLYREYKNIISKTYGIEDMLKQVLKKMAGVQNAYIFGSYATGNFDNFSDIDLLVIGEHDALKLSTAIHKIEKMVDREINIVEFRANDFKKQIKTNPLLINIFKKSTIKLI